MTCEPTNHNNNSPVDLGQARVYGRVVEGELVVELLQGQVAVSQVGRQAVVAAPLDVAGHQVGAVARGVHALKELVSHSMGKMIVHVQRFVGHQGAEDFRHQVRACNTMAPFVTSRHPL